MNRSFLVVNAFSDGPFGGNPAGVFFEADGLEDAEMAAFTRQLNLVECVFVLSPPAGSGADRRLRYFTPAGEIPVAGHPSIAAWSALAALGHIQPGAYVQENLAGQQAVTVTEGAAGGFHVAMGQPPSTIHVAPCTRDEVSAVFGLGPEHLAETSIDVVQSGLGHLAVGLRDLDALAAAARNVDALRELCQRMGVREAQLYAPGSYSGAHAWHTRNLCPREGLEDPACGVGNGALAVHLGHRIYNGAFRAAIEQGHVVSMPSLVTVEVFDDGTVTVGGTGTVMVEGRMMV